MGFIRHRTGVVTKGSVLRGPQAWFMLCRHHLESIILTRGRHIHPVLEPTHNVAGSGDT